VSCWFKLSGSWVHLRVSLRHWISLSGSWVHLRVSLRDVLMYLAGLGVVGLDSTVVLWAGCVAFE
jgi:hypothetical protein